MSQILGPHKLLGNGDSIEETHGFQAPEIGDTSVYTLSMETSLQV